MGILIIRSLPAEKGARGVYAVVAYGEWNRTVVPPKAASRSRAKLNPGTGPPEAGPNVTFPSNWL